MYTSSLMKPIAMDIEARSVIDVVVTTTDQYMDKQGLRSFDFIQFDLQGNELKALKGAPKALKSCKNILVEVNLRARYEGLPQFNTILDALIEDGYCLYKKLIIHG